MQRQRPTVRQLESLVAVADHLSFRRAAGAVGITQPAISPHVPAAARARGVQVFERDRRAVLVTPAGADVVAHARAALAAIDEVDDAARRRARPLVGPLRLGVIPTVAPYWLPALLPAARKRFPELELILREDLTSRLLAQLAAGQLDAVLVALPVPGDVTAAVIARERFVLAVPRGAAIARRRSVREADLRDEIMLLLEDGHCLRDQALAVCERAGAVEALAVRATSLPTLAQMVAGGLGMTLLPETAAAALAPARGAIEIVELAGPPPGRTIGLVWRTSSARLREFKMLADVKADAARSRLLRRR